MHTIKHRLRTEVVASIVPIGPEDTDRDLFELGLDSMELVHVLAQSELLFGVELSSVELWEDDGGISVAVITKMIATALTQARREAQGADEGEGAA